MQFAVVMSCKIVKQKCNKNEWNMRSFDQKKLFRFGKKKINHLQIKLTFQRIWFDNVTLKLKIIRQRRIENVRKLCNWIDFSKHQFDFSINNKQRNANLLHALHKKLQKLIRSRQYLTRIRVKIKKTILMTKQLMNSYNKRLNDNKI